MGREIPDGALNFNVALRKDYLYVESLSPFGVPVESRIDVFCHGALGNIGPESSAVRAKCQESVQTQSWVSVCLRLNIRLTATTL